MGRKNNTWWLDQRHNNKVSQEGIPQWLLQLARYYPLVHVKQTHDKNYNPKNNWCNWQTARKEQAGFRKGRGCINQIFALRNIIEQCTEWQRQLYINCVDFQKAFDSINRKSLWRILRAYGILKEIVLTKSFYSNFIYSVGHSNVWFVASTTISPTV